MQNAITRLALFQFLTVLYCIFFVGLAVKIRYGSPAPPIFATHLRDYGFLLLLIPAAWLLWASTAAHRPLAGTGDLAPILTSGVGLLIGLVALALIGTGSVMINGSLVKRAPRAPDQAPSAILSR